MSAPKPDWWHRGLESGILLLTLLALSAMARVHGVEWVVVPMIVCLLGCVFYRLVRPLLFAGVEVLLVVAYFVFIWLFHAHVWPSEQRSGFIQGLDVIGLVILYPAQMALWTGSRSLQELVLLGLVAVSQFLYGMTLAPWGPASWVLGVLFFPALVYALLHYATAREIDAVSARPPRPRAHRWRLGGLALILVPITIGLGAAMFYLLPRYSTLTQAFDRWGKTSGVEEEAEASGGGNRRGSPHTGLSQGMDLLADGRIRSDRIRVVVARVWLENAERELQSAYSDRIHLRSMILDECRAVSWVSSRAHWPQVHRPDGEGVVQLPGPASRPGLGFRLQVKPLARGGQEHLVALGRAARFMRGSELGGHPEEGLEFRRPRLGDYQVDGERVLPWEGVAGWLKRNRTPATHDDLELYTGLPERPLAARVKELAERMTAGAMSDAERVESLLRYLRSSGRFSYTLDLPPVRDRGNPTADFLFRSRVGHCSRYADALAVLCRHLDIPARIVKGYFGGSWRDVPTPGFVFRARDAHAWVEVHFKTLGWVAVDPSPSGDVNLGLVPELDGVEAPSEALLDELALKPDSFTADEQLGLYEKLAGLVRHNALWVVAGAAGLVALMLLLVLVRRRRGSDADGVGASGGKREFNPIVEFYRALRRLGIRPGRGETPLELARRAEASVEVELVPAMQRMYAARYGGRRYDDTERKAFNTWLKALRGR